MASCYVWPDVDNCVKGYYTLSSYAVHTAQMPEGLGRKIPYDQAPAMLIGRLAIDSSLEKAGYGKMLLMDALKRCMDISQQLAATGVIVDAIDEEAVAWYLKSDFIAFPENRNRLFLPMGTIERMFALAQ